MQSEYWLYHLIDHARSLGPGGGAMPDVIYLRFPFAKASTSYSNIHDNL